jgi:hypothetical protein
MFWLIHGIFHLEVRVFDGGPISFDVHFFIFFLETETIKNSKGKAEALNEQFKSVFTKEELDNFPQIDDSGTPDIPNLNISTEGHDRLFLKPCWKSTSMLCLSRWFIICLNMTSSMILQGTDVNDTGR